MTLQLKWWEYLLVALSIFIGSLFLNFFVKKINEARLEERLIRLQKKNSTNRSTQVKASLLGTALKDNQSIYSGNPGISLVYNKEENLKNNIDTNSYISRESSKESAKLKFLGTIYNTKESVLINNDNNNDHKRPTISTESHLSDVQNNDFKEWISELIFKAVFIKL